MNQQNTKLKRNLVIGIVAGIGLIAIVVLVIVMLVDTQSGLNKIQDISNEMLYERIKPVGQVKVEGVPEASLVSEPKTVPKTTPSASDTGLQLIKEPKKIEPTTVPKEVTVVPEEATSIATPIIAPEKATPKIIPIKTPKKVATPEVVLAEKIDKIAIPEMGDTEELEIEQVNKQVCSACHTMNGEQIYKRVCTSCHTMGIVGAPKLGEQSNWTPRIAKGMDTLFTNALQGFRGEMGIMPPRGGQANLLDEEVKAAVIYMMDAVKSPDTESIVPKTLF